jgi:hypothetical protein
MNVIQLDELLKNNLYKLCMKKRGKSIQVQTESRLGTQELSCL